MSHHHGKDLRKGRFSEPGRIYLLTTVTKDRNKLFTNLNNSRAVINELLLSQTQGLCENIAWVVMPDHLHWLVSLHEGTLATQRGGRKISGKIYCRKSIACWIGREYRRLPLLGHCLVMTTIDCRSDPDRENYKRNHLLLRDQGRSYKAGKVAPTASRASPLLQLHQEKYSSVGAGLPAKIT
jgi:REP element-mobilizing transposase RayT